MQSARNTAENTLRSILEAGSVLQQVQTGNSAAREMAFERLYAASVNSGDTGRRGFSGESPGTGEPPDWEAGAAAASIDLTSAEVLAGAAMLRGEIAAPPGENAMRFFLDSLSAGKAELNEQAGSLQRLGFRSESEFTASSSVPEALDRFRSAVDATVNTIVDNSEHTISPVVKALLNQSQRLGPLWHDLDELFLSGSDQEGFAAEMWSKLKSGLGFLWRLTNSAPPNEIANLVNKISADSSTRAALSWAFDVNTTRKMASGANVASESNIADLDLRTRALGDLAASHASFSKNVRRIASASGILGSIAAYHFAGPAGLLLKPGVNALLATSIVLAGLDFNDTNEWIDLVRGVRKIMAGASLEYRLAAP